MSDKQESRGEMNRVDAVSDHPAPQIGHSQQIDLWPDMTNYRKRFDEIRSEFIEDPKSAVTKAEQLVEEAIDQMAG